MPIFKKTVEQVIAEHKENKTYAYKKGDITLSFNLNPGDKGELEDFLDLLLAAERDIKEDISNPKKR